MPTLFEKLLIHMLYTEYIPIGNSPQAFKTYLIRNISDGQFLQGFEMCLLRNILHGLSPEAVKTD